MAPVTVVLESFLRDTDDWSSVESQGRFAQLIESQRNDFGPSESYLKSLVRQYVSQVDASNNPVEDDDLLGLILFYSMTKDSVVPDPLESCHVSFRIPTSQDLLRLRVFPRHNDVALKVWEAGACLAEYLLQNPQHVAGKQCCELGAGVGLTGLVVAAFCRPARLHMTDYTEACLSNLRHNIHINNEWLRKCIGDDDEAEGIIMQVSCTTCQMSCFQVFDGGVAGSLAYQMGTAYLERRDIWIGNYMRMKRIHYQLSMHCRNP